MTDKSETVQQMLKEVRYAKSIDDLRYIIQLIILEVFDDSWKEEDSNNLENKQELQQ